MLVIKTRPPPAFRTNDILIGRLLAIKDKDLIICTYNIFEYRNIEYTAEKSNISLFSFDI